MKTKLSILTFFFSLLFLNIKAETNDYKLAFVTSYENIQSIEDDDEIAAATWFKANYPDGKIVSTSSIKNNSIDLSQFKVIWIHVDRENSDAQLPIELIQNDVKNKIKDYYKNGGNLLLTNHSTQYLVDLGRTARRPNIISSGVAVSNDDIWTVNPNIGMTNDYFSHPIYNKLSTTNSVFPHPTIPLLGSGLKENHNSMWDLNAMGYTNNVVSAFENENKARVIGTWGHVTDYCCAGIVEFRPTSDYRGNCIAIGVSAYEWNQNNKTNNYLTNIKKITTNAITYLSDYTDQTTLPATLVAHFPMELNSSLNSVKEIIGNRTFMVDNAKSNRENLPGAEGNALRFDGFSTFIRGRFNVSELSSKSFSSSIWCALESYPMMNVDGADQTQTYIAGNMNANSGFAFTINSNGRYGFEVFVDGVKQRCYAYEKFPLYEWVHLSATVSVDKKEITLYKNNELIANTYINASTIDNGSGLVFIGKSYDDNNRWVGPFRLNTINGLIDDFRIYSGEQDFTTTKLKPENSADLSIPKSRFEEEIQRPKYHALQAANWTNEPHGLIYHNNKYHLFFQKNGAGPYWGRINWGHLSSVDLISWKEEKPSIVPGNSYDFKGAWSGCVFADADLTNGVPHIFYTAVDFARASIAEARPLDNELIDWTKHESNPIIPHAPPGLDEDFRDPFIFKANATFYMIVGARKGGRGATTLHEYNAALKTWSNDGRIFYQTISTAYGAYWEMPIVIPMNDGKFLFAVTNIGGRDGVETLYWVGTINANGTFNPFSNHPKELELNNMSKDGFGLLSPSVLQHDGKNIAIGIVPDKLSGEDNKNLGWAHLFSLPREWTLDINNNLIQKPYEGLKVLRNNDHSFSRINEPLSGIQSLQPVEGKTVEIEGIFTVSSEQNQKFGFNVRKSGDNAIKIFYEPSKNKFTVDARAINRLSNDGWLYNGLYESVLPEPIQAGETLKMHIFIDHSIMDIFLNNKWAFSIRIFPTEIDANGLEVFSENNTTFVNSVKAWKLMTEPSTAISDIKQATQTNIYFSNNQLVYENLAKNSFISIYDSLGRPIVTNVSPNHYTGENLIKNNIYLVRIISANKTESLKIIK